MAISSAEVVRLTVARIMSNGAPVCSMSVTSKRREIASRSRWGTTRSMAWLVLSVARTMARAKADEPYSRCSCSSFWLASESSVSVTCIALRDVQSVRIITTPAPTRKEKLAGTFSLSASIVIAESPAWRAIWKASQPAIGTPMKFTRSFPAKASARGEGAAQDRDAQDVDLETLDEEEDEAACQPADQQREKDMVFDRMNEGRLRQRPF